MFTHRYETGGAVLSLLRHWLAALQPVSSPGLPHRIESGLRT